MAFTKPVLITLPKINGDIEDEAANVANSRSSSPRNSGRCAGLRRLSVSTVHVIRISVLSRLPISTARSEFFDGMHFMMRAETISAGAVLHWLLAMRVECVVTKCHV